MAKSMRSKREKRLRAIRRDMVEPFYDQKDVAKLAAIEAALAAPKLPVRSSISGGGPSSMDASSAPTPSISNSSIDVEMADDDKGKGRLKPAGGVGKKLKKKLKIKGKKRGKGKLKRRHI